ncbi:molybdopterin-guanine dinucleotide biosynthesis protein MobA [Corynebacterium occultum]|uniref:Molybdopterin-guanine dinucleotide biosynthesis protein MobA n=1 Tax=Corynebacterium occultum TaxID=2675219 RepID=A0A6B8VVE0_9CORY|nr:molybdenum cofactor guanylyltransferase [Corynebacterium occultum]QGU07079.1 molybdopterin-guanine dinucleotide biosynthesis protein MobA [Corynebacterium occultum]
MNTIPGLDVLILAGGRGSRLGGIDKATVRISGERLIDLLLDEVSLLDALQQVVVVSSRDLTVRPGVKKTAEEPAFSGPVSAIAAGVDELRSEAAERTAILAVDAPESATLIPDLLEGLDDTADADVAVIREAGGHLQPLCAVWNTESLWAALEELGDPADRAARALIDATNTVVEVAGTGEERDFDTLEDLAALEDFELPEA